jgi:hypothetical protein
VALPDKIVSIYVSGKATGKKCHLFWALEDEKEFGYKGQVIPNVGTRTKIGRKVPLCKK